jgi:atlastin
MAQRVMAASCWSAEAYLLRARSCFLLPHPGLKVTRKDYDGAIGGPKGLEPEFRELLDKFVRRVFGHNLEPKRIHGRQLTGPELLEYIKTYVALFQDGKKFPEAKTVLQATVEANNRNAATLAFKKYTEEMDRGVGAHVTRYLPAREATALHAACSGAALELFAQVATMGPKAGIAAARALLEAEVAAAQAKYAAMNSGRNPMARIEPYLVPVAVACAAYLSRWAVGVVCNHKVCAHAGDLFGHMYVICVTLMVIASAGNIKALYEHIKSIVPLVVGDSARLKSM